MEHTEKSIITLWKEFNKSNSLLVEKLGRSKNTIGEFGEYLAYKHYGGTLYNGSYAGADLVDSEGVLYQVKTRQLKQLDSTSLGIIRSWEFDYLVVLLFGMQGEILKALEVPVDIAKEYAKQNDYQNGTVITTTNAFLNDDRFRDLSDSMKEILGNENFVDGIDDCGLLNNGKVLPIEFIPNDKEKFIEILLQKKQARYDIIYQNGSKETKQWNITRLSETSSLVGNIRSREEFRQGEWQEKNIKLVRFYV